MALIELNGVSKGGSEAFIPTFTSGNQLLGASQPAGALITLTPPDGERVKLHGLASGDFTGVSNVNVTVGGKIVVSTRTLAGATANEVGNFNIVSSGGANGSVSEIGTGIPPIVGRPDEVIVVSTTSTTANPVNYGYQFGGY